MLPIQGTFHFTSYSSLYDLVVPKDNILRKINELVDFSFVYDELAGKYCLNNGRMAEDPVRMFKYLMIKSMSRLSDADLVDKCMYDMSYKLFLGLAPEDRVIEASTLTKFRRKRLTDAGLLDRLISKTVEVAMSKGIDMGKRICVDSTHASSRYNPLSPASALREQAKRLRKAIYETDGSMKGKLPEKYEGSELDKEMDYVEGLLSFLEGKDVTKFPHVSRKMHLLSEMVKDIKDNQRLVVSTDHDARIGHKSAKSSFFGYKLHLAESENRMVVAATVTSGEKGDGPQLPALIRKAKKNVPDLKEVVGDGAYSGRSNLENAEKENVELVSMPNPILEKPGSERDGFTYNKDAQMMVCPAGEMSSYKYSAKGDKAKHRNAKTVFVFGMHKCESCPTPEKCGYRKKVTEDGKNTKKSRCGRTYIVTVPCDEQKELLERKDTKEFKDKYRGRYIIEAKNSELKHSYHLDESISYGTDAMTTQCAVAIFTSNLVRIHRILEEKAK